MICFEKSPCGLTAILLVMAGIVAVLATVGDARDIHGGQVWFFQQPAAGASAFEGLGNDHHDKSRS